MPYRFDSLLRDDPYYAGWVDLRRRTLLAWAAFFGWPVLIPLVQALTHAASWALGLGSSSGVWFLAAILAAGLGFIAAREHQKDWPCPRCGEP